jgi:putative multiple sugar transport system substrate-binding protein
VAQARMENLLSSNYTDAKVDGVLSPYDGLSIGIISALTSGGYSADDLPVITGQDAEAGSVKSIIGGEQYSTIFKDTRELGKVAAQMVDAILQGDEPEVNDTKTYDNGKKVVPSYLLKSVIVTKDNYKSVLVDSGYYTEDDLK